MAARALEELGLFDEGVVGVVVEEGSDCAQVAADGVVEAGQGQRGQ